MMLVEASGVYIHRGLEKQLNKGHEKKPSQGGHDKQAYVGTACTILK